MSFVKKNIWRLSFIVVLVGAFLAMGLASKNSSLPSSTATAKEEIYFEFTEGEHVKGAENPKVTIVEFSDFQCPACAAYYPVMETLLTDFPEDLQLVYKHFPLRAIHFQAENTAKASEAAALQGKFWDMHKTLFDNQSSWSGTTGKDALRQYAENIGLDMAKYDADIESDAVNEVVKSASQFAVDNGLNSTPTFYMNGRKIGNPASYESFKELIEQEISSVSNQ